jgi:hypothetical protein
MSLIERWAEDDTPFHLEKQNVGKTFREALKEQKEQEESFQIVKTDDDKHLVFGWANVAVRTDGEQIVDLQQDMIDPEDLEDAVYEYVLNFRDGGEEHDPSRRQIASLVESCVFTPDKLKAMGLDADAVPLGWWIGFYVDDDDAWEKIKDGTYRMFSIEGQGTRVPVEDEGEGGE